MTEVNTTLTGTPLASTSTATGSITIPAQPAQPAQQNEGVDYEKLASIIDGKLKATEDSVLKGYFKEQGLTGDEIKSAIEMFKKDKASKQPDYNALNAQLADREEAVLEAQSRALYAETQLEAMNMASELGVEQKTIPYLMRMADLTDVITDGQPDQDKLKESLSAVLKDVPQLKMEAEDKSNGFKVGADTSNGGSDNTEQLARIFGVKKG